MAIQFPIGPFIGDTFPYDDMVYVWDGEKWTAQNDKAYWDKDGDELKPEDTGDDVNLGTGDLSANNGNFDGDVAVDGDIQASSFNGGQLAGFRNQIINGLMLINNRDNNNLSNPGEFCPDRWYNTGSSILGLNKLTTAGLVGVGLAPVSGTGIVRQAIELPNPSNLGGNVAEVYSPFQPNSVWTLSLYSDNVTPGLSNDGLQYADGVAGGSPQDAATGAGWVSEGNGRWSNTYTFNSSSPTTDHNCLIVQLQWTAGRVGGVQLEPGHVATPFEHLSLIHI